MIAVDTNILVYSHRPESPWHTRAKEVVADLASASRPWAIPWPCIHEFLSIVTKGVFKTPTPLAIACDRVAAWLESPTLVLLAETDKHWRTLQDLVSAGRIVGGAVHDARIAALCLQHGVSELYTADRDFSRFPALRTRNPLI
ncbi:MAG: TA system VapC family ribonuclease toxin [Parvularculaceae bacterium]|nr:TA system VapC family ribonuclease toxin [Parvularculaceae bacterium]